MPDDQKDDAARYLAKRNAAAAARPNPLTGAPRALPAIDPARPVETALARFNAERAARPNPLTLTTENARRRNVCGTS
jgi:hypothetical protein